MVERITKDERSEEVRQKSGCFVKGRFFALEQYTIRDINWRNKFSKAVSEVKIVVSDTNANIRVFRCQNRRGHGGCPLCIYGFVCPVRRFIENLGGNIRIMECPYLVCGELLENVTGNEFAKEENPLFSFAGLVAKGFSSNPVALNEILNFK